MLKITSLRNIKPCHYGSLLFIVQDITGDPRGFNGYLFSGSWRTLVIIFRYMGSKLIVLGI